MLLLLCNDGCATGSSNAGLLLLVRGGKGEVVLLKGSEPAAIAAKALTRSSVCLQGRRKL
jgi:hypothetical protein